ncbi:MAG: ferritin-like domain-containing protein [Candidatus Poseidoniaceae archaeon]|jgi:bacterioferritin (cytochrome b1)|nr:ferritin-like domain-containing protein [Candidatus Poseidoniaceae archaeon]
MSKLIDKMNEALGWELRAINMYAHYAANVKGMYRLQLEPLFQKEATESMAHAGSVRNSIVKHGGICVTERNEQEIIHTENYREMLEYALDTEIHAAKVYSELMILLEEIGDTELYDSVEQIHLVELRSVEEIRLLLG